MSNIVVVSFFLSFFLSFLFRVSDFYSVKLSFSEHVLLVRMSY